MSDLSNLYISQSYKGLVNFADSTQGFESQSNHQLQDGLGNGIGISIETGSYNVTLTSSLFVESEISSSTVNGIGNVEVYSASVDLRLDELEATASDHDPRVDAIEAYTSSLREALSVTGSNTNFSGNISVSGSITAHELFVTVESSSVILSSGSNILGDEPSDVQILSGSVYVPNLHYLAGNPKDTNLRIDEKLDTGSFLTYSASVATELAEIVEDALPSSWTGSVFLPFSSSVSQEIDALEDFSSSLVLDFVTQAELTATRSLIENEIDKKLDTGSYDIDSASFDTRITTNLNNINTKLDTGSYLTDSASFDSRIDTKLENSWTSSVFEPYSASVYSRVQSLIDVTGSYATTGSNNFFGSQSIDGDVTISGSLITSGSNTLIGNNTHTGDTTQEGTTTITGSLVVSGSSNYIGKLQGNVVTMELTGSNFNTASFMPTHGHFHILDLNEVTGSSCRIELVQGAQIVSGLTLTMKVKQPITSYCTLEFASQSFQFPRLTQPITTPINGAVDILTFVSFDNEGYYGIITKDMTPQIT